MENEILEVKLTNVRLSYPSLFTKKGNDKYPNSPAKYSAVLILDKVNNKQELDRLNKEIDQLCKKEKLKIEKIADKNLCLLDGDETEKAELANSFFLKTSNKNRPQVVDKKRNAITEEDGIIYAGCYVNAIISMWSYDNGIGCNLHAVQFSKNGDPFGGKTMDLSSKFDDLDEDDIDL